MTTTFVTDFLNNIIHGQAPKRTGKSKVKGAVTLINCSTTFAEGIQPKADIFEKDDNTMRCYGGRPSPTPGDGREAMGNG